MIGMIVIFIILLLVVGMITSGDVLTFFKAILAAIVSVLVALVNLIS